MSTKNVVDHFQDRQHNSDDQYTDVQDAVYDDSNLDLDAFIDVMNNERNLSDFKKEKKYHQTGLLTQKKKIVHISERSSFR